MTIIDSGVQKTGFVYNLFVFRKRAHSPDIKMSAKKLINNVDHVVDEALEGLVKSNPGVNLIENHRVVVRSDLENLKDKVALVAGGGSGHEPAFAGYVGKGCLSSAVAGSVFASPPPSSILASILTLAKHNPSGILVVRLFNSCQILKNSRQFLKLQINYFL